MISSLAGWDYSYLFTAGLSKPTQNRRLPDFEEMVSVLAHSGWSFAHVWRSAAACAARAAACRGGLCFGRPRAQQEATCQGVTNLSKLVSTAVDFNLAVEQTPLRMERHSALEVSAGFAGDRVPVLCGMDSH